MVLAQGIGRFRRTLPDWDRYLRGLHDSDPGPGGWKEIPELHRRCTPTHATEFAGTIFPIMVPTGDSAPALSHFVQRDLRPERTTKYAYLKPEEVNSGVRVYADEGHRE